MSEPSEIERLLNGSNLRLPLVVRVEVDESSASY